MSSDAYKVQFNGAEAMISTSLGDVRAVWTSKGHVSVTAYGSGHDGTKLVYRGRSWYAHVHLYADTDWTEETNDPGVTSYKHQFTEVNGSKTVPPTFRVAIVDAIREAVRAFVAANPGVLPAAERARLETAIQSADKAAREAREAWEAADQVSRDLRAELRATLGGYAF